MAEEDNKTIKEQANMQREKSAPQPREKENDTKVSAESILEEINKKLQIGVNIDRNDIGIQSDILKASMAGFAGLGEKLVEMSKEMADGTSLKEEEEKKEAKKREEKTNGLLQLLVNQAKEGLKEGPKGILGVIFGALAFVGGSIAGFIVGFTTGLFDGVKNILFGFKDDKGVRKGGLVGFIRRQLIRLIKLLLPDSAVEKLKGARTIVKEFIESSRASIVNWFKNARTAVAASLAKGAGFGKAVILFPITLARMVGTFVKGIGRYLFTALFKNFAPGRFLASLVGDLTKPLDGILGAFAGAPDGATGKGVTQISKAAKGIKTAIATFINPIGKIFTSAFTMFAKIGRSFGRLFLPLTIVFAIFDTIKGIFTGLDDVKEGESKILSMFLGGLKGLLQGFIGAPLDLLKDGIAWVSKKLFGENNPVTNFLNSFSFTEIIGKIIDIYESVVNTVINFVTGIAESIGEFATTAYTDYIKPIFDSLVGAFNFVKDGFLSFIDDPMGAIRNLFIRIIRSILPTGDREWYDPLGVVQRVIPDSVYDFAGVNKETGEFKPLEMMAAERDVAEGLVVDTPVNSRGRNTQTAIVDASSRQATNQTINIVSDNSSKGRTRNRMRSRFG